MKNTQNKIYRKTFVKAFYNTGTCLYSNIKDCASSESSLSSSGIFPFNPNLHFLKQIWSFCEKSNNRWSFELVEILSSVVIFKQRKRSKCLLREIPLISYRPFKSAYILKLFEIVFLAHPFKNIHGRKKNYGATTMNKVLQESLFNFSDTLRI